MFRHQVVHLKPHYSLDYIHQGRNIFLEKNKNISCVRTGQQFISPNNLEPVGLPLDVKILPEHLASLGYTSHMLGRWSQGFCSKKYLPTNRGFKSFYGNWASGSDHVNHLAR